MANRVAPTKNNLMAAKKSLSLAKMGYDLMGRKKNILVREIMSLLDKADSIQSEIEVAYADAYDKLKKAHLFMGSCMEYARSVPVDESLDVVIRSVMGVELPEITVGSPTAANIHYGLTSTSSQLDDAYAAFQTVKTLTVQLADIESNVIRLADAISKTQKRTNALNNIMIPRLEGEIKFISDALDEKDREDFSRLKVIKRTAEK
ncbi:MAG: V-type ATP synthase subunit D [Clostridia bacterium]|nr:V-type ATP synthase subunit D [Clostridia bacterium]